MFSLFYVTLYCSLCIGYFAHHFYPVWSHISHIVNSDLSIFEFACTAKNCIYSIATKQETITISAAKVACSWRIDSSFETMRRCHQKSMSGADKKIKVLNIFTKLWYHCISMHLRGETDRFKNGNVKKKKLLKKRPQSNELRNVLL